MANSTAEHVERRCLFLLLSCSSLTIDDFAFVCLKQSRTEAGKLSVREWFGAYGGPTKLETCRLGIGPLLAEVTFLFCREAFFFS